MDKIIVIGCSGAGKSTFARELRDLTGLPLIYLDRLWHKEDRTTVTREEFDASLAEVLAGDKWIIDGNYSRTLETRLQHCDTVIFLNYPTELCLEGAAARIGTVREDLPWVEEDFDPEFRQWILDFSHDQMPRICELLKRYSAGVDVITFHSREEASDWLKTEKLRQRFRVLHADEEFQRAGAYYVRIQAMAKAYHITLREEFDEIDGPDCHYVLALDDDFPAATCRWFETGTGTVEIGRVVVLPEYRGMHLGSLVMREAESWIKQDGYQKIVISCRKGCEPFYEKLGYKYNDSFQAHRSTFDCVYMEKYIKKFK